MSSEDGPSLPMFKLETWVMKMRLEAAYKSSSPSAASSVKSFDCAMNSGHEQVLTNKACHFSYSTPGACPDLERTPLAGERSLARVAFANPLMAFYVHWVRQGVAFCKTSMTVSLNCGEVLAENCHRQIEI